MRKELESLSAAMQAQFDALSEQRAGYDALQVTLAQDQSRVEARQAAFNTRTIEFSQKSVAWSSSLRAAEAAETIGKEQQTKVRRAESSERAKSQGLISASRHLSAQKEILSQAERDRAVKQRELDAAKRELTTAKSSEEQVFSLLAASARGIKSHSDSAMRDLSSRLLRTRASNIAALNTCIGVANNLKKTFTTRLSKATTEKAKWDAEAEYNWKMFYQASGGVEEVFYDRAIDAEDEANRYARQMTQFRRDISVLSTIISQIRNFRYAKQRSSQAKTVVSLSQNALTQKNNLVTQASQRVNDAERAVQAAQRAHQQAINALTQARRSLSAAYQAFREAEEQLSQARRAREASQALLSEARTH
ncbi:hypothetical protein F7Q91_24930, partial [Vibrio chagasii]